VNAVSSSGGLTPLHIACEHNMQPNIVTLIKYRWAQRRPPPLPPPKELRV
jgi:hypothetical protein